MEATTEDSFTPFDFEEAFVARQGIKPEEAGAPYERGKRSWKEEKGNLDDTMDTTTKTSLATSLYPTSEMSTLARYGGQMNLDTIQTRGVRDWIEGTSPMEDQYSQSTIQIDSHVLRDLLAGRWPTQGLSSNPSLAENPRYTFTVPPWNRTYDTYGYGPKPIGWDVPQSLSGPSLQPPPSLIMTELTSAPSTIGPSASLTTDSTQRKHPLSHAGAIPKSTAPLGMSITPSHASRVSEGSIMGGTALPQGQSIEPPLPGVGDTMEFTGVTDSDCFYGVYPDLMLPVPVNPRISQVFYMNMSVLSGSDSPMMIVMIPSLLRKYVTSLFGIDQVSGRFSIMNRDGVQPLDLFGWIANEGAMGEDHLTSGTVGTNPMPRAASTPNTEATGNEEGIGTTQRMGTSTLGEDMIPPLDMFLNPCHQAIADESSVTTLGDKDHIENKEYQEMVSKLAKVSKKHRLVLKNWSLERKKTASALARREVDVFYKKILQDYEKKKQSLTHAIEMYENFYQEHVTSPMDMTQSSKSSTAEEAKLHPSSTSPPFVPSSAESMAMYTTTPEGSQATIQGESIQPPLQTITSISMDLTYTVPVEGSTNRTGQAHPTAVMIASTRIPLMPAARGRRGVHTTPTTVTHTTPIS